MGGRAVIGRGGFGVAGVERLGRQHGQLTAGQRAEGLPGAAQGFLSAPVLVTALLDEPVLEGRLEFLVAPVRRAQGAVAQDGALPCATASR